MTIFDRLKTSRKKTIERVSVTRGDLFERMTSAELADLPPFHPRERR